MFTEPTTFRPRNGLSAEAYWRVRAWCEKEGFSLSDVLNAVIVPLAYYLENHCIVDKIRSKAVVILNIGELDILHVFQGKCYPLVSSTETTKDTLSLENMRTRIEHWKKRNTERPEQYDLMILPKKKVYAKISKKVNNTTTSSK